MKIAEVNDGVIGRVAHYTEFYPHRNWKVQPPDDARLAQDGYKKVSEHVSHDPSTQKLVSCTPFVDGNYVVTVAAVAKTSDELAQDTARTASANRSQRDMLLAACDWTQIPDSPLSAESKTAWATYRQELRDITSHANWPNLVGAGQDGTGGDWPTKPS